MAVSAPRTRVWGPGRLPKRWLLVGLALVIALGGAHVALKGNPLAASGRGVTYPTSAVTSENLQVTISATGPISNAVNFPLSFKSSGKLAELDVVLGQTVAAGQV